MTPRHQSEGHEWFLCQQQYPLPDKMLYGISALYDVWHPIPKKNEQSVLILKSVKLLLWFLFLCKTWRETQNSYSGLNKPQRNDDSRRQKSTAKILLGAFFVGKHWLVGFEFQEIEIEIETRGTFANTIVFYVCSQ